MCNDYYALSISYALSYECWKGAGLLMNRHIETDHWESAWNNYGVFVLGPYDPATMGAITVFDHYDCKQNSGLFYWNPDDPFGGQYVSRDFELARLSPNLPKSVLVPRGYTAVFYSEDSFENESQRIIGSFVNDAT